MQTLKQSSSLLGLFIATFLLFWSCNKACPDDFQGKEADKAIVAFYPSWKQNELATKDIRWDKITRLIYAFAAPTADGGLDVSSLTRLKELVKAAHKNGVEVYVSIGGNRGGEHFPAVAISKRKRTKFIGEIVKFATENCLDGIDIDWEYLSHSEERSQLRLQQKAFVVLLHHLHDALTPLHKSLSIDVYGAVWSGGFFLDEAVQYVDEVHIMAYDFSGKWSESPAPHSSFEQAIGSPAAKKSTGVYYWLNVRKWPKEKLLIGLPFYGRDFKDKNVIGKPFKEIIRQFPAALNVDSVDSVFYNGHQTIKRKVKEVLKQDLGGVMIWELTQDTEDETSLLKVINETLKKK